MRHKGLTKKGDYFQAKTRHFLAVSCFDGASVPQRATNLIAKK
jgi:hypothetical protein